jgi:hypothetical protein
MRIFVQAAITTQWCGLKKPFVISPTTLKLSALAIAKVLTGDIDKAQATMKRLLEITPNRRISNYFLAHVSPERRVLIGDILRKAGMPE